MCGIAGTIGYDSEKYVDEMNQSQFHRGPDDGGVFFDKGSNICIGMRRLSIIDLANGHQPMANEDNSIFIVFNGEIFNAISLRKELVSDGHLFRTKNSDTEVLIHMYEKYGTSMLKYLNGMFAFIIWDQNKKCIFASRDYAGIKPLYYAQNGNKFLFASELKSIMETGLVDRNLDMKSVFQYLSLQFIPAPETIYFGVKKLPAASYLTYFIQTNELKVEKYWHLPIDIEPKILNVDDAKMAIKYEFEEAVKRWTISDVPVAASLSGGIDSTAIVAMLRKNTDREISTYTLGFNDSPECDEHILARTISNFYGTKHHEILLTADDLLDDFDSMIYSLDEPYGGGLPSWYIYKYMSENFKVGFTGLGGDELFGNYGKWIRYDNLFSHVVRIAWQLFNKESLNNLRKYPYGSLYHKYMTENIKDKITNPDYFMEATEEGNTSRLYEKMIHQCGEMPWKNVIPWIDFQMQLPEEFLHMTDRFSMNFSVEARVPFLDKKLIETVYSIDPKIRTKKGDLKYLFIDSVRDKLPDNVINAPKKGFVLPYNRWLNGKLKDVVMTYTSDDYLNKQGIFSNKLREVIIRPYYNGKKSYMPLVWTVLMFQLWYEKNMGNHR